MLVSVEIDSSRTADRDSRDPGNYAGRIRLQAVSSVASNHNEGDRALSGYPAGTVRTLGREPHVPPHPTMRALSSRGREEVRRRRG